MIKQNFFREREHYVKGYGGATDIRWFGWYNQTITITPNSLLALKQNIYVMEVPKPIIIRITYSSHQNYHLEYRLHFGIHGPFKTIYVGSSSEYHISIENGRFIYSDANQIKEEIFFEDVIRPANDYFIYMHSFRLDIYLVNDDIQNSLDFIGFLAEVYSTSEFIRTLYKFLV